MSDEATPVADTDAAGRGTETLNPEAIDGILNDFRAWLTEAREAPREAMFPEMDLATVVQQFTALRQDVNLQTKASRAQTELNGLTLERLQQTIDTLKQQHANSQANRDDNTDEAVRPLLKTLVDLRDALALARREVQRMLNQPAMVPPPLDIPELHVQLPFWARLLGLGATIENQVNVWRAMRPAPPATDDSAQRVQGVLDALLVGYQMSLQRIERAMENQGLEVIPSVGRPLDPETMEVVEVLHDPNRAAIEVVDEVRPGYLWRGQLFRYAQVRVAKP